MALTPGIVGSPADPLAHEGGTQYKSYAPGVGLVEIAAVGDKENETLMLVSQTDIRGTAEWDRVLDEVDRLSDNACAAGYDLLCP